MKFFSNKWRAIAIVLAIILLVTLAIIFLPMLQSSDKVVDKAMDYINNTLLGGVATATLDSVVDNDIKSLYRIKISIEGNTYDSFVSSDGRYLFVDSPIDMSTEVSQQQEVDSPEMSSKESVNVEGGFKEISEVDVCNDENGKPLVYFFGSESCPHCEWQKPIMDEVSTLFGDYINYHENFDGTTEADVLLKYGNGAVPALIIGCKYYRIGSGEASTVEADTQAVKDVICRATGGIPASICE
ncbi:MAG: thioredoxin family protein [Candidatus Paceibacterota bacterium]|jgi:thiol-disulfide isomerase/thioredoxin